jgi:hypothetical protein
VSLFWGRRGHEKHQHGDTEGLRDCVSFVDVEGAAFAADEVAHLRAGYAARFREGADGVRDSRPGLFIIFLKVSRSLRM